MILEGIVTTVSPSGEVNIAPMGPRVEPDMRHFLLRPFPTAQTYRNLKAHGEGVLHVTDDVLLLAQSAVGKIDPPPRLVPAITVKGFVLADACRYYEFRVLEMDESEQRVRLPVEVVHTGRLRDFFGFNRAKHAVVEAAILATRIKFLPHAEILREFERLSVPIEKTAGPQERRAFEFLENYVRTAVDSQTPAPGVSFSAKAFRSIRVASPSRLHFGMFSFGRTDVRQFGGVGVMVDKPGMELVISPAERLETSGPLAGRVREFAERAAQHAAWLPDEIPCCIKVVRAPRSHVGLGSGTQLGMAVAQGLNAFFGGNWQTPQDFARAAGRGRRSAIGLHGAVSGGLLIEGGKRDMEEISPLISRIELPEAWRFVLCWPGGEQGLSGEAETEAFQRLPPVPLETTAVLCQEALLELAPAAAAGDIDRFGESVYRFGRTAGQCFAAQQGSEFANPRVARLVAWLREQGVRGVGQSSWGPSVFALTPDLAAAEKLSAKLASTPEHRGLDIVLAAPANRGAAVTDLIAS